MYGDKDLVLKDFPIKHTTAPNPNSLSFEHRPTTRKVYPPGATI